MPRVLAAVALGLLLGLAGCSGGHSRTAAGATPAASPAPAGAAANLQPGSDPSALPGPVLIADRDNNRLVEVDPQGKQVWEFPRPGDLAPGQTFKVPDDAFFTSDGKRIVATEEDNFVISLIDVANHRIVWRYGTPGMPGSAPGELWNPDDAIVLPDGNVLAADIKNCRLVLIPPGGHAPKRVFGETTRACTHAPPGRWGSPNGAFPLGDGTFLVTEIDGDWVDQLRPDGTVGFSIHPPGVHYPSDANEVSQGHYVVADYSQPGQVVEFDQQGNAVWTFAPRGDAALNHPSLAMPLPNGDVICTDDRNHRVIVFDPRSQKIVWQYGQTGQPGRGPGLLANPDGLDLAPPHGLLVSRSRSMGHLGAIASPDRARL